MPSVHDPIELFIYDGTEHATKPVQNNDGVGVFERRSLAVALAWGQDCHKIEKLYPRLMCSVQRKTRMGSREWGCDVPLIQC